jgi:hypothetical protein
MLRIIMGVIVGVVAGGAVIYGWEILGHKIWPLPPGLNVKDPEQLKTLITGMPVMAIAWIGIGYALGVFVGSSIANVVAQGRAVAGWVVAVLLMAGAVWTMIAIPHPLWFIGLTVVMWAAAAWGAARWQGRKA